MKFKTDENVPGEVSDLLKRHGFDSMTIVEQKMGGFKDEDVAVVCRKEGRVLLTLDLDFSDLRSYPPGHFPGLIVLRPTSQSRAAILSLVDRLIPLLHKETLDGKLWIVDSKRVRIRD